MTEDGLVQSAARAVRSADALLIAAGAGMGVGSGLPDFRGADGFWRAYPPYAKLGLGFTSLANPRWFTSDPALAWGFYGHRLNLYRAARPPGGLGVSARSLFWMPRRRRVYSTEVTPLGVSEAKRMSDAASPPPGAPTGQELKAALKAFKKRLKLTRLDEESRIGGGPLSGGRRADIVAITPPSQYPQAVWEELVKQGKLKKAGHGMYELAEE